MSKQIGLDRDLFGASFTKIRSAVDAAAANDGKALRFAALVLERHMKLQLSHPGSGRVYRRGGHTHQASAPGESPAPDTGTLRASIGSEVVANGIRVGTNLEYGADLEFGTLDDGGFIAPRPWARPAAASARDEMGQAFVGELRSDVRGRT